MPSRVLDLLIVRHGLTDWNENGRLMGRRPIPLNDRGHEQAQSLAVALADRGVERVLACPQVRARETAQPIAARLGLSVETVAELEEVWIAAAWEGKTFMELRDDPEIIRYFRDATFASAMFEPAEKVRDRVVALTERLRSDTTGSVVLVSHGDPLRVLLGHYLGISLTHYRKLAVLNGALSVLRFEPNRHRLLALNWSPRDSALREILGTP